MAAQGGTFSWNNNSTSGSSRNLNGHVYGNIITNNTYASPSLPPKQPSESSSPQTLRREDYTVGWICALPIPEWQASRLLLDEEHEDLDLPNAQHQYVFGKMNGHNVVMGCLPDSQMGIAPAAGVAAEMRAMFPALRFGLLVGVGGGVWSERHDVRLGDVVVSRPDKEKRNGGVVQYDYGKAIQGGEFQETGMLNLPPTILLSSLGKLQSAPPGKSQFLQYLKTFENHIEDSPELATRPKLDRLFAPSFTHVKNQATCKSCPPSHEISRPQRLSSTPKIHYGTIASGNQVIKDASKRDAIAEKHDILCFEMEAAGLMNQFPCLVVRGICDYCDSHKNKAWQAYAAAAAASWGKELLRNVSAGAVLGERTIDAQVR